MTITALRLPRGSGCAVTAGATSCHRHVTQNIMGSIVSIIVGVVVALVLMRQCRRPVGPTGRLIARSMNRSHGRLTAWGLAHLTVAPDAKVLDVGCGGGQTIATLASMAPHGEISGIDYSAASVATARATNAQRIAAGQVDIRRASVSALPFSGDTFDLVTAIETHYYWPDLPHDLREISRVLVPGGRLMILAEAYRGAREDWVTRPIMAVLGARLMTPAEHCELFVGAGFIDVEVHEDRSHGWLGVIGRKPPAGTQSPSQ